MRNMEDIMKFHHAAKVLRAHAESIQEKFWAEVKYFQENKSGRSIARLMEGSDSQFKLAAEAKMFEKLADMCEHAHEYRTTVLARGEFEEWKAEAIKNSPPSEKVKLSAITEENILDVTWEDLRQWAMDEARYYSAMPRSTSQCHNLMEQFSLQAHLDFVRDRFSVWGMLRKAQMEDSEFLAWRQAESEREAAFRAKALEQAKYDEALMYDARRAVARLVKKTANPAIVNTDALVGWKRIQDVLRIRNDKVREFVMRVHDTYHLVDGKVTRKV